MSGLPAEQAGIWGRWSGKTTPRRVMQSVLLKRLIGDPAYPNAFQYSLLQIVPRSYARHEVLRLEKHYKAKHGRLAVELNGN